MELTTEQRNKLREEVSKGRELKTMVFTDMVGSTRLKQELGDTEALRLMHQHHQLVRDLLAAFPDAMEISTAGDSFFLAFDAPSNAVRFSLQLQAKLRQLSRQVRHPIEDRIGIHVGEVFRQVEGDTDQAVDLKGIQVDTCARVMSQAGARHILLTRFAYDNARQMLQGVKIPEVGRLEWESHGFYELKGINEPVEICEVAEAGATEIVALTDSGKVKRAADDLGASVETLSDLTQSKPWFYRLSHATVAERRSAIACALVTIAAGLTLLFTGWLDALSFDLTSLPRLSADPSSYTKAVEFVAMDDDSLAQLGQRSLREWDRGMHAQLVNKLAAAHARAVVFDIVFQTNRPAEDPAFLAAIRNFGRVVVAVAQQRVIENGLAKNALFYPFAELTTKAWHGLTESAKISDLTLRRPRFGTARGNEFAPLATLAEELVNRLDTPAQISPTGAWLNYYCPPARIPMRPYYQVLSENYPSHIFSNKVVFVGSKIERANPDEPGSDQFRTPFSIWGHAPALGVVVNATSYLNLKRGDWLRRLPPWFEFLLTVFVGGLAGYVLVFMTPTSSVLLGLILAISSAAIPVLLAGPTHTWFPWLIVSAIQIPCALVWCLAVNERQLTVIKRKLQEARAHRRTRSATDKSAGSQSADAPGQARSSSRGPFEVPDHQLIKRIGEGAYGQVWLARDAIGTYHAVKILQRSSFSEGRPYEREFHGLQQFTPISRQHPGLVQILHVGRNDRAGFLFYVMEAADDEHTGQAINPDQYMPRNLSRELKQQGPMSVQAALDLGIALAEALEFVHNHGLIHRDIKPANIIFVQGRPKLADIGSVTAISTEPDAISFVGTAGYVAPEGPGTAAADLYGLGKLLYVASTGCTVQQFPDLPTSLSERADVEALLNLNKIVLKACEPVTSMRYGTAQGLLADLRQLRASLA